MDPGAGVDISRKRIYVFVCNLTLLLSPVYIAETTSTCKIKITIEII
jgi:hypothetical protein